MRVFFSYYYWIQKTAMTLALEDWVIRPFFELWCQENHPNCDAYENQVWCSLFSFSFSFFFFSFPAILFRIPTYIRSDFSYNITLKSNPKELQTTHPSNSSQTTQKKLQIPFSGVHSAGTATHILCFPLDFHLQILSLYYFCFYK
jgi:hypothetical protein